jgi:hypothetical protein
MSCNTNSAVNCFLCRYNSHRDAIEMNQFIEENIGYMHLDVIAHEVHTELMNRSMSDGNHYDNLAILTPSMIKEHVASHTLNPVVRIGIMLRGLLDLDEKMKHDLYKVDTQGQCLGLDPKMIDAYLRLQNQVINIYKSDPAKLPYNKTHALQPNSTTN